MGLKRDERTICINVQTLLVETVQNINSALAAYSPMGKGGQEAYNNIASAKKKIDDALTKAESIRTLKR